MKLIHARVRVKLPASVFPAVNARESVVQTVFSGKIARGTEVKVKAYATLPPDPWNALLAARVTNDVRMKVTYNSFYSLSTKNNAIL